MAADADRPLVCEWRDMLSLHARTWGALERELNERHGLGASEFEVLDRLIETDKQDCRVQELSAGIHLSQSALSRLIARLERDGLVTRGMCPDDRRNIFVSPTQAGRALHEEAVGTHRAVLEEFFAAGRGVRIGH
ncbi:MarR family transcriptional regulator [Actinosynnema sp. ALI-1.44]|uniref:MarR family winged helix-turn-helix transcriptional regulator n=1 Tax=Actinosynnema sp. ALI-1.44 TaxID=1933779 RepID=UPI00097BCBC5|nr:MarR family transcriptional regulator [Actinosynnema sp. ALI-1.44]ONI81178.1 MarR family transcriptional regulator [Actinosynnema sp. ALI-1.44]